MTKFVSKIILYAVHYPVAVAVIVLETIALVLFLRYLRTQKEEKTEREIKAKKDRLEKIYTDITNPRWVEQGGLDEEQNRA